MLLSYVYFLYYVCIAVFTLDAGLLARSQYSEGPATGHLDTGFSWFPCAEKQMLRWFPKFQVATSFFSCSPPDLNLVVTNFMFCLHVKEPLPPGDNPIAVNNNNNNNNYYYYCLQDPVFKILSSLLFSEFKRPNYTAMQNCRPKCGFNILIFHCIR